MQKLFVEQVSSVTARPQLEAALDFIREGDVLIVSKLDRLARSIAHLTKIVERIQAKGASLRILNIALDTETATGKLMLNLLGSIAEFEREMLLSGNRSASRERKPTESTKARKPTARSKSAEVRALHAKGQGPVAIAKALGISRASVFGVLPQRLRISVQDRPLERSPLNVRYPPSRPNAIGENRGLTSVNSLSGRRRVVRL